MEHFIQNNTSLFGLPPNKIQKILCAGWSLIKAGVRDRRCAFHLLTVAFILAEGVSVMSTVVLRDVNVKKRILQFHTDR